MSHRLHRWFDGHMRDVLRGGALAFVLKGLGAGLSFGFHALLARTLGAAGVGLYMLALTVVAVAAVVGRLGLDSAILRFVAAGRAAGNASEVKGVVARGAGLAGLSAAATALLLLVSAPLIADNVFGQPDLLAPLRWISLAVAPVVFVWILSNALLGLERVRDGQVMQSVAVPALNIALLFTLSRFGFGTVVGAVWAFTLANLVTAAAGFGMWRRATPELRHVPARFERQRLLSTSLPLLWVASIYLVNGWIATTSLGLFRSAEEVGIYSACLRTALLVNFVLTAFGAIASPKFAALHARGELDALAQVAAKTTRVMTALSVPAVLALVLFPQHVLALFGPEFEAGAPALVVLALGQFFSVTSGMAARLLMMTGHGKELRRVVAAAATVNVVLCLALVPGGGILGAAVATTASWIVNNVLAVIVSKRRVGVATHVLARPGRP